MADQQYCLRWNNHQNTLISVFDSLQERGCMVDCTLGAEGQSLQAHKVVLSACSPYLEDLLTKHYDKHPILILKDVRFEELKAMVDYMYRGEVNVAHDKLNLFLRAAESLQIKGLSDSGTDPPDTGGTAGGTKRTSKGAPVSVRSNQQLTVRSTNLADDSRDGSVSPSQRKRRRRRGSDESDNDSSSNVADGKQSSAAAAPVTGPSVLNQDLLPTVPASVPADALLSSIMESAETDTATDSGLYANAVTPSSQENVILDKGSSDVLVQPKTEYLDDDTQDLALGDDDSVAGPSHSRSGNFMNDTDMFMADQDGSNNAQGLEDGSDVPGGPSDSICISDSRTSSDQILADVPLDISLQKDVGAICSNQQDSEVLTDADIDVIEQSRALTTSSCKAFSPLDPTPRLSLNSKETDDCSLNDECPQVPTSCVTFPSVSKLPMESPVSCSFASEPLQGASSVDLHETLKSVSFTDRDKIIKTIPAFENAASSRQHSGSTEQMHIEENEDLLGAIGEEDSLCPDIGSLIRESMIVVDDLDTSDISETRAFEWDGLDLPNNEQMVNMENLMEDSCDQPLPMPPKPRMVSWGRKTMHGSLNQNVESKCANDKNNNCSTLKRSMSLPLATDKKVSHLTANNRNLPKATDTTVPSLLANNGKRPKVKAAHWGPHHWRFCSKRKLQRKPTVSQLTLAQRNVSRLALGSKGKSTSSPQVQHVGTAQKLSSEMIKNAESVLPNKETDKAVPKLFSAFNNFIQSACSPQTPTKDVSAPVATPEAWKKVIAQAQQKLK